MPQTHFPNGLSSYGVPVMPAGFSVPNSILGGKTYFVDGTYGNNGNDGLDPARPFGTIQAAIDASVGAANALIYVFPGTYAENVVVNKGQVAILGAVLSGYGKPVIAPATGKALYNQGVNGMILRNVALQSPALDTDLALVEGNGYLIENCLFIGHATQGDAKGLLRLKGATTVAAADASNGLIRNSVFRGSGGLGIIFDDSTTIGLGCTDVVVDSNTFVGNDKSDIATADTGAGTFSIHRGVIVNNVFADKNKTNYIDMTTANGGAAVDQTGIIANNYFAADALNTTRIAMVGTGFTFVGNYSTVGVVDGNTFD